jgi:xylulokinase
MKRYLLGIDIGTQGTKTCLFDIEGNSIASSFEPSHLISPKPGVVEQDPEEIYQSVANTIRNVIREVEGSFRGVEAIGIDSQMSGIMGIDSEWKAATPYDSWLDTRCEKYIKLMKSSYEDEIVRITGCPPTYHHGPKILWWKYERPEVYKKISKFVIPAAYIAGRLAGLKAEDAYIDYTNIHFSGFADTDKMQWSQKLIDRFDVDIKKMPRITEPWEVIGFLTNDEAKKIGLRSGIPIVAGCGDQAATSLGAGVVRKGIAFDVAGTASVFSCCVDSFKPDVKNKTLISARSVIKDLWVPLAYINGGGLCLKWFRDQLTGNKGEVSYSQLDSEATNIDPGSNGLLFNPHFGGRVCPNDPGVRGSWIGLNWGHLRAHMFRSIMESIAYEYKTYLQIVNELFGDMRFTRVISIGGGSKSRLFCSIKSNVLGIPYAILKSSDTATLGSALVAGYGAGIYDDMASKAENLIKVEETVVHSPDIFHKYTDYVEIYRKIFTALSAVHSNLEQLER